MIKTKVGNTRLLQLMFIGFGVLAESKVEAKYSTWQVPMGKNLS